MKQKLPVFTMLKNLAKVLIKAKAVADVLKDKLELKAANFTIQPNGSPNKSFQNFTGFNGDSNLKEKAKEELVELLSEINYRAQINETQLKGLIKDKLVELTNNALLDSAELNSIRSEIAGLRAEVAEMKTEMQILKRPKSWFKL